MGQGARARSSVAERPAHNRLVVGSNPAGPTMTYRIHNSPVQGDLCGVRSPHWAIVRRGYGVDDGGPAGLDHDLLHEGADEGFGLVTSMTKGANDSFTVSAWNLVATHSYTIRVESNNSDVGFNSSCSDLQEDVTVSSGRTSHSTTFTLYGCDTSGGTVTATLRRGTTSVDTYSQYVGVTAPSIEIQNLATTMREGQSDSFLVWASNLSTSHRYTIQVETDNSDIGFNATCSIRSRTQSVPSSSTSESAQGTRYMRATRLVAG